MEECVGGKRMHTVPPPLTPPLNEKDGINGADDKSRKSACPPIIIRARIQVSGS
jgi:hypothetical protein